MIQNTKYVGQYSTIKKVEAKNSNKRLKRIFIICFVVLFLFLFLPWTQNIRTTGNVTTLTPNHRPQKVTTIIDGRIQKWFVKEGDLVQEGDTLLKITEIKDAYFDENLLERTGNQVNLKKESIVNYDDKVKNYDEQLKILVEQRDLKLNQSKIKLKQAELKMQSDSIAFETSKINLKIADYQLKRTDSLYRMGLKSLTDLETKRMKKQQVESYKVKHENIWLNSKTNLINLKIEISNVQVKFESDYNKILSMKLSALNEQIDAESTLNKLENQLSNYEMRAGFHYVFAPQSGYVTKLKHGGTGETVKAGSEILTLMPSQYDLAVEIYIKPIDLPLIQRGQKVRIQFDGWPAIVFSGWPNVSHGTYGGEVYAIDQFISPNGKFRLLVKPDDNDSEWPDALRFGGGTNAMLLLNDVSIWYEMWRNVNGFPPDFYKNDVENVKSKK